MVAKTQKPSILSFVYGQTTAYQQFLQRIDSSSYMLLPLFMGAAFLSDSTGSVSLFHFCSMALMLVGMFFVYRVLFILPFLVLAFSMGSSTTPAAPTVKPEKKRQ